MLGLFLGFGNGNVVKMGMDYMHVCLGVGFRKRENIYKLIEQPQPRYGNDSIKF